MSSWTPTLGSSPNSQGRWRLLHPGGPRQGAPLSTQFGVAVENRLRQEDGYAPGTAGYNANFLTQWRVAGVKKTRATGLAEVAGA